MGFSPILNCKVKDRIPKFENYDDLKVQRIPDRETYLKSKAAIVASWLRVENTELSRYSEYNTTFFTSLSPGFQCYAFMRDIILEFPDITIPQSMFIRKP